MHTSAMLFLFFSSKFGPSVERLKLEVAIKPVNEGRVQSRLIMFGFLFFFFSPQIYCGIALLLILLSISVMQQICEGWPRLAHSFVFPGFHEPGRVVVIISLL